MNVYESACSRIDVIFNNFENVYLSFSGGKDSGVMLNLCIDRVRDKFPGRRFTVLYIDLEAMYQSTITFVEKMLLNNHDVIDVEWVCLPMTTTNSVSMYEPYWIFWDKAKKDLWVRDMPVNKFVINEENNIYPFFIKDMTFEDFIIDYAKFKSKDKQTACLVGIRADESLNRWRAVNREDIDRYNDLNYSVKVTKNCYNFYPVFDFHVNDIWTYNGKFQKPYNKIYDLMYLSGVPLHKMRVCEPYGDEQKAGLHLFKILEPATWAKVVNRVAGANFGNIYSNTKATGARRIELPKGHTWKSYCKFLLKTLPVNTANTYKKKFIKFIRYWVRVGCPLQDGLIDLIRHNPVVNVTNEFSIRGKGDKFVVRFTSIPDTISGDNKTDLLSWKRMCYAILKNDIACKSLSFSLSKAQMDLRKKTIEKIQSYDKSSL
jgi:predicted phosphoadenosine phosphosulfate sulfurtransferase